MSQSEFERYLEDLKQLIQIESIKSFPEPGAPYGKPIKKALMWFKDLARRFGFPVNILDDKVVIVDFDDEKRDGHIAIFAHLDVVTVEDSDDWIVPPFSGKVKNGRMYGRGTLDNKGPALAILYAMNRLKTKGFTPEMGIRLVVGGDEESGMDCIETYKKHMPLPDFGFTPDAMFPVTLKEKGIITFEVEFLLDENSVIHSVDIGRSTNVKPSTGTYYIEKGNEGVMNFLDNVGTQVEELEQYYKIDISTKNGDAIPCAVNQLEKLVRNENSTKKSLSILSSFFLDETGEKLGIASPDEDEEVVMKATKLQTESNLLVLTLDIRYPTGMVEVKMKNRLTRAVTNLGLKGSVISSKPPIDFDEEHPMIKRLIHVYESVTGRHDPPASISGGTYARVYPDRVIAFGALLPGEPITAHQKNEYVKLELMRLWLEIYEKAIKSLS